MVATRADEADNAISVACVSEVMRIVNASGQQAHGEKHRRDKRHAGREGPGAGCVTASHCSFR